MVKEVVLHKLRRGWKARQELKKLTVFYAACRLEISPNWIFTYFFYWSHVWEVNLNIYRCSNQFSSKFTLRKSVVQSSINAIERNSQPLNSFQCTLMQSTVSVSSSVPSKLATFNPILANKVATRWANGQIVVDRDASSSWARATREGTLVQLAVIRDALLRDMRAVVSRRPTFRWESFGVQVIFGFFQWFPWHRLRVSHRKMIWRWVEEIL